MTLNNSIEALRKAANCFNEGAKHLNGSSLEYLLKTLLKAHELAVQWAPFKKGDRVTLTSPPDMRQAPEWSGAQHFLVPGEPAIVEAVTICDDEALYGLVFANESWLDSAGVKHSAGDNQHVYAFREKEIQHLEAGIFDIQALQELKRENEKLAEELKSAKQTLASALDILNRDLKKE